VLPSEAEWYKAAYYKGGGTNSGYWLYPTSSDSPPTFMTPTEVNNPANQAAYGVSPANTANYAGTGGAGYPRANGMPIDVGSYPESVSPCGALDMGGNAMEWLDTTREGGNPLRGGCYTNNLADMASTVAHGHYLTMAGNDYMGFRVGYVGVPEPGSLAMLLAGGISLLACAWRRRRV
jgi:formylglycine-generating enzyme required for sulfatase activity